MRKSSEAARAARRAIREDLDDTLVDLCHRFRGAACRIHGCLQLAQMEPDLAQEYVTEGLSQCNALLEMIDNRVAELQALLDEIDK